MYTFYNPNPKGAKVGDCTIRAISKAMNESWEKIYMDLTIYGFIHADLPSANNVWGAYLYKNGFRRYLIPEDYEFYTVRDFADNHKEGIYILALSGHVVAVVDGDYYDSWDSGDMIPIYYWKR